MLAAAILIAISLGARVGILTGSFWSPTISTIREIAFAYPVTDTTFNARFPIVCHLHDQRRKVIRYFLARSNKNWHLDTGFLIAGPASNIRLMEGQVNSG